MAAEVVKTAIAVRNRERSWFTGRDFVVDERIVVETKAVDRLAPIHEAQLITYLKLLKLPRGLLLNFNVPRLTKGLRSIALR